MVRITQDESNALNVIGLQAGQLGEQLKQLQAAQLAVIRLLEDKYAASFDAASGTFIERQVKQT